MKDAAPARSPLRTAVAVLIGLIGAVGIWIAAPYNDTFLYNPRLADGYLPLGALMITLLLVLAVNPLLRCIGPQAALTRRQLVLILVILLMAGVVPGPGLMRYLPYSLAKVPRDVSADPALAEEYAKMGLPGALFPDPTGYRLDTPHSDGFVEELLPGHGVPWSAWAGPLWIWGSLMLFAWMLMAGLAAILMPQWRDNERLAFPLVHIQEQLIEPPEAGHLLGPLFRRRSFWIAAGVVLLLRVLIGLSSYWPESVPAVPLRWDLQNLFTEEPLVYLPRHIYQGRIYFMLIGIAFFMPNRTSVSIWFLMLAYAAYEVIGKAYAPPFNFGTVREHRLGAVLALTVGIVWLGRHRWRQVFAALFRRPRGHEDRQDRLAGMLFLVGCGGVFAWLLAMGVQPGFAALFTVFACMVSLVISRIVAETGLPFVKIRCELMRVVRLMPAQWIAPVSLYFGVVIGILFTVCSRASGTAIATQAMALHARDGRRDRGKMALLFVGLCAMGFLISGASHLNMNYHNASDLIGNVRPINRGSYIWIGDANWGIRDLRSGQVYEPAYSRHGHVSLGFGIALVLLALCMAMPRWPLHPIGLLLVGTWMGGVCWFSIFLGWLTKQVLVKYGGARAYRGARAFFLGLIIGEVFAAVFGMIAPVFMYAATGIWRRPSLWLLF